jgi:hypothetical protein
MSVAVQCAECPSLYAIPSSTGFSDDYKNLMKNLEKQILEMCEPLTIKLPLVKAKKSLREVYKACSEANWDGYNALPITENTFEEAWKIIELLPTSIPMPEILAEPGGEIGFEWHKGKRLIFVISVEGKYRINYAGIFGSNKIHGSEYFGEMLPSVVIENLRRLFYR